MSDYPMKRNEAQMSAKIRERERPGEQQAMSRVEDVAARNRVPRSRIFEEIRYGRLVAVKVGRLTRIRREDEDTWRATLPIRQAMLAAPSR
jgi:excisionase family DNA binding protein